MNSPKQQPKRQSISTAQIKQGLEKIRQTQLQVLNELRRQQEMMSQQQNVGKNKPSPADQNPAMDPTKNSEIMNLKNELALQRERSVEKVRILNDKIKRMEHQSTSYEENQIKWKQDKANLERNLQNLKIEVENLKNKKQIVSDTTKFERQIEYLKGQIAKQQQINKKYLQQINQLRIQNQKIKEQHFQIQTSHKKLLRQMEWKQKNNFEDQIKENAQNKKQNINFDALIQEIHKISGLHDKTYEGLKSRTKLNLSDLQNQQEIQNSFSKILQIIQVSQKYIDYEEQSLIHEKEHRYDSESFREDVKKLQKQLGSQQEIKKEINDLKAENAYTKSQIQRLKINLSTFRNENQALKRQNKQLNQELSYLRSSKQEWQRNNRAPAKENTKYEQNLRQAQQTIKTYEQQIKRLVNDKREITSEREDLKNQCDKLQDKLKIMAANQQSLIQSQTDYKRALQSIEIQTKTIKEQKSHLSELISKITQINTAPDQQTMKILRQQLNQTIQMNGELRKQNQSLKKINDALTIKNENYKFEIQRSENNLMQKHILVNKEMQEKGRLIDNLNKQQKQIREKQGVILKLQTKILQLEKDIESNTKMNQKERQSHGAQLAQMHKSIENYLKEQHQLRDIAYRAKLLKTENEALKKNIMRVNATTVHLWEIKQTQYANVNDILKEMKGIRK